jgi:hypothetical protein
MHTHAGPSRITIPSRRYEMESDDGYALTPVTTGSLAPLSKAPDSFLPEMRRRREDAESLAEEEGYEAESDPFVPFPDEPGIPDEKLDKILRVRAVVVGCALGALVNASNIYLGMSV